MGFFTAAAATAAAAAGTYMQGQAQADAAKGQAALGEYNAAVAEKDAIATEAKTRFDQIRQVQAGARSVASVRAKAGASGARLDVGAPMHIVAAQVAENEIQNALIGYAGKTQADRHRSRAAGYRAGAKFAEMRADNIKTATLINTGSSLLDNVGAMYDQGMFTSATPAAATTQSSIQDQRMAHYSNL